MNPVGFAVIAVNDAARKHVHREFIHPWDALLFALASVNQFPRCRIFPIVSAGFYVV